MARNCSIEGCNNKHDSKGFCKLHYLRWKRHGGPLKLADLIETRKKMSDSQRKRKPHTNSIEALRIASKNRIGLKRTDVGKKISQTLKAKWARTEFRDRMMLVRKKQFSDPKLREKMSRNAKTIWLDPDYRKHQSESHKGVIAGMLGKKHSEESKKKMSDAMRGRKGFWTGKKYPKERKEAMSARAKKRFKDNPLARKQLSIKAHKWLSEHPEFREQASARRSKQKFPYRDTKLEIEIQEILKGFDIPFRKHYNIKLDRSNHQADILVEPNLIIEGFGDYWHFNPRKYDGDSYQKLRKKIIKPKDVWEYDKYVIDGMKKQGYEVLVVWEYDLKKNTEETKRKILEFIHNPNLPQTL